MILHNDIVLTAWDKYMGVSFKPSILIGDDSSTGSECHISAINKIIIGKNVLFGKKVTLVDNSHGLSDKTILNIPPAERLLHTKGPIIIGDNVWIGDKVSILSGVSIGENAIIGANSVVTKNVPKNSIVAGIPARIIKYIN